MNKLTRARSIGSARSPVPVLLALVGFSLASCGTEDTTPNATARDAVGETVRDSHDHGSDADGEHGEDEHGEDEHGEVEHGGAGGAIHLSREQIAAVGIGFGEPTTLKVNDYLSATGKLDLPPNAYTAVSARAAGFIRDVRKYVEGDYVKRGAVIAYLENPAFIEHQREYLEAAAELPYLEAELARQEALVAADAGIVKDVQRLRSQVAAKRATVKGLGQRLSYLGINPERLTLDNITSRITLSAPSAGYVTEVGLHNGRYVEPSTELLELIDTEHLHLELAVFERDIAQVSEGQRITYQVPALGPERYEAEVHVIGRDFNAENTTVLVHAHPRGKQPRFIRDLFVEARLWLSNATATALPEEAVLRDGEQAYVFIAPEQPQGDEVEFERFPVKAGATEDGFTAVTFLQARPAGSRIVTEGAYYVYAQGQAGALEHDH